MTRITRTGNAALAAISPDGRFVIGVLDNGRQSLWLRNIPTGSDTQVIPPSDSHYLDLSFSPDGDEIYFRKALDAPANASELYRVPILGGAQQKVIYDIDSNIAFAPDGHRIAFIRGVASAEPGVVGKFLVLTSTLDGKDERVVQSVISIGVPPDSLAWDSWSNRIAYSTKHPDNAMSAISLVDVNSGQAQRYATFEDKVTGRLAWSRNGKGIFIQYAQRGANVDNGQIGFLTRDKELQPITRDANSYSSLSTSADDGSLVAVQEKWTDSFYLAHTSSQTWKSTQVLSNVNQFERFNWTTDGNVIISDGARLMRIGLDGRNESQLLADANAKIGALAVCGLKYVVFSWKYQGGTSFANIWRVNGDGSGAVKLTSGRNDIVPVCSPDQKWVYYIAEESIFRVPLDGSGKPEEVVEAAPPKGSSYIILITPMSMSADGKTLAFAWINQKPPGEIKIALMNLKSPASPRLLNVNPYWSGAVRLNPDGESIAYKVRKLGVENIWLQPTDGSPGRQITSFSSDDIREFHWSPDGKTLGILREKSESDVVLLQETRQ
jgi:Tol biopolymer transport system component